MQQAHVFISGFVQGVGFRQFVKHEARELGLTGWVKNLPASPSLGGPDQRLEVLVQGARDEVEQLIKQCKKGPFLAEVEEVEVLWEKISEKYVEFKVLI